MKKTGLLFLALLLFCHAALSQVASYIFTATAGTYSPINGATAQLTGNGTDPLADEGVSNNISIGFNFNYLGSDYTAISASTNGFAALGNLSTASFSNNISNGNMGRPLLAPFWEDLALTSETDIRYITTGAAGSRVFILQWSNVMVDFGANSASISFQLKLYETTNVVEFIYSQLPGATEDFSGGASIGITGLSTGTGNYLSLNNSGNAPTASSSVATNNILARPATGQIYRFTPPSCTAPGGLSITNISATDATISWTTVAGSSYQYAVTTSVIPPASGQSGNGTATPVNGLTPGTQYYLHVRTNCGGTFSGWSTMGFSTNCNPTTIPYTMPITGVVCPALPLCTTVKDENMDGNTWRTYNSAGPGWTDQVIVYVYNPNETTPADDWLFTAGLNLTAGATYRLRFKYNNDSSAVYPEKLKVAYGNSNTVAAMTNILADYPAIFSPAPKIAILDFTPSVSGIYYIGFQAYSDADRDVLILDDITVGQRPPCDVPGNLSVDVDGSGIAITASWTPPSYGSPIWYEASVDFNVGPPAAGTPIGGTSVFDYGLTPGLQYYLHLRSYCGGPLSDWVTLPFTTLGNDEICKATVITEGGTPGCGNTTTATTSASDPPGNCSSPDHTVWYKYTATTTGTVVLHMTTPAAPADPLHGWVGWYVASANCPNPDLAAYGYCAEFGNNGNNDVDDLISPVLMEGETYYIMIDGYSNDVGRFCISIPPCSPAINVSVSNVLSSSARISWSGTGTFILEYGPHGFIPGTAEVAGTGGTIITPAVSAQIITGLAFSTSYDVYVRQNCSASNNGYSSNSKLVSFTTTGQPPPNDLCSGAIILPVNNVCTPVAGNTLNATKSTITPAPSCGDEPGGYDDDVWYKFTPAADQVFVNIDFTVTGGYSDIAAQIYTTSTNNCSGTFSLIQCSDDGGTSNLPRFTGLRVTPGTTYYIRVFSDTVDVSSQFTICVTRSLPPNNDAAGAIGINVGAGCNGAIFTNETATQSAGEPTGSCSSTTGYATVWFKFIAPPSGAVRISTATGDGNTLTNTRVALFQVNNVNNYGNGNFNIIACDEDGGSGAFGNMSVLYATGLIVDNTYYVQVDKFDSNTPEGTFCLTVDEISPSMLATTADCNSGYQTPVGSVASYNGWVSLMDQDSKLIALVRNTAGGPVNAYTAVENINTAPVRKDITSGEYYLDRSFTINTVGNPTAILNVQFFFLNSDLDRLKVVDPAASLSYLRVTKQSATSCQPDFATVNGINSELTQASYGTGNGVSWLVTNTGGYANHYIHAVKSYLSAKIFLQGAYSPQLGRHKDVTNEWANVLNTYAKGQPYNSSANVDTAREGYGAAAVGGAGQQVVHVTNLNANGPGSLFAAMGSHRTIVFDVAGTINNFDWEASSSNSVTNLTIDGSTAPSPGITLNNGSLGNCFSFNSDCHDIIIKHVRVRNSGNDGINVIGGYNFLFDHVSISGSGDGDLDLTDGAHDITVQWSIFGPGKANWSGAMLIAYPGTRDISLHHNLYTTYGSGVGERNPLVHNAVNFVPNPVDYLMSDFTNNIVWKWGNASDDGFGYGSGVDYGGTLQCRNNFYQSLLQPANAIIANHNTAGAKLYASGNVSGNLGINPNDATNVSSPWAVPSITMQDACTAATLVLQKAGPRPLDEADQTFVNSVSLANCPNIQNQPPFANAGSNISMVLPSNSTTLIGSGNDPDGTIINYDWSPVSVAGPYTLGIVNSPTTTLSNLVAGIYRFRLRVTDNNGAMSSDTVTVTVVNSGSNQPPVANAGNNITLTLPFNSTTLAATAFDADGIIVSYAWTLISGPASYLLATANASSTTVSNLTQGTYIFRLTVTDNNGLVGTDNVTINVIAPSTNSLTNYSGTEKVNDGFFTATSASNDIVDWVVLEIKNIFGGTKAQRAAFVREDGQIVDLDGTSPISLYGLGFGNYYITVKHRNHLGVRSSTLRSFTVSALGVAPALTSYDFTTLQTQAYQDPTISTNAAMAQNGSVFMMWGGNANLDQFVRVTAQGIPPIPSDVSYMLGTILGGNPNATFSGYSIGDINMDGRTRVTAQGIPPIPSDVSYILGTILGGNPNATRREHR